MSPTFDGKDLPPVIQRAITRAMDPSLDLSAAERVALATLLARAEARDGTSAFWVRRLNFAAMFERAERTVSTWLAALEDKGWIAKEQGRTRWGSFQCLTVHLTEEAAQYLGLTPGADLSTTYRKKTAGRIKDQGLRHSFGDTAPAGADSWRSHAPGSAAHPVPADCQALLGMGMRPTTVFWLMRQASQRGKRLGDVLAAKASAIAGARRPLGLLVKLIRDDVDYSAMHRREQQQALRDEHEVRAQSLVTQTRCHYAGATVELPGNGGRAAILADGSATILRLEGGHWRAIGSLAGASLRALWDWLVSTRPPTIREQALAGP